MNTTPASPSITMVPVPNCDGAARFIPSDRADLRIDRYWLKEKFACTGGVAWFEQTFPEGCTYLELRTRLVTDEKPEWEDWLKTTAGGDTATAGDRGTATAGDSGTATAGDSGTATAGDSGTATAGYSGTATAGDRGTATAGDRGTATAGYSGTATAGYSGTISILEWDEKNNRWRVVIGYVGEGGIEANVPYQAKDGKLVKAPHPEN